MTAILKAIAIGLIAFTTPAWPHGSAPESGAALLCEGLLTETSLTRHQLEAVLAGHHEADDLQFRILSKKIGKQIFTIVLLGELHDATEKDLGLGYQVARQFKRFATENGHTNNGKGNYSHKMMFPAALADLPGRLIGRLFGQRKGTSPMEIPKNLRKDVDNAEEGHRPSIAEELNLLGFAMLQTSVLACAGTCAYSLANVAITQDLGYSVAAAVAGGYLIFTHKIVYPLLLKHTHRLPIVRNRDVTIARNMSQAIEALSLLEPEHDGYRWDLDPAFLVILGRSHLKNVSEYLVEKYGFYESPLPSR